MFKFLDKISDYIQGREERRRNEIDKLEERQRFIKFYKRNDLANEFERNARKLEQLYKNAKNS